MSRRRVVVTGLGIVSPVGNDVPAAWDSILAGRSGIGPVTRFDTTNFPTHFGGEIRDLDLSSLHEPQGRAAHGCLHAVRRGRRHAGDARFGLAVTEANSHRIGVLMGSGMGGLESIEETYDKFLETHSPKKVSPFFIPASIINLVSGHLSIAFNLTGPNLAVATACTTSTHAHRPRGAPDSVRRCRRDARRRLGNGDLRHRRERLCAGQGAVARATTIRRGRAGRGTRIATDS